jgi:hypothetical protein
MNRLVDASIHFIRTLSEVYGNERAMEFWSVISDNIDPDLKGKIFSAMLGSSTSSNLRIISLPTHPNVVAIVKEVRLWDKRLLSIKEAKDMVEGLNRNGGIDLQVFHEKLFHARQAFNNLGCITV